MSNNAVLPWEDDRPLPRPLVSRPAASSWVRPLVALGLSAAALSLVAGALVLWWCLAGGGGAGPLTQWVPGDADSFRSVRLADLWGCPEAQKALEGEGLNEGGPPRRYGLKATNIERLTEVRYSEKEKWAVIETVGPYDEGRVRGQLKKARKARHAGKKYFKGEFEGAKGFCIHFAGDRLIVVAGDERSMKKALGMSLRREPGPLDEGLAMLSAGRYIVEAGRRGPTVLSGEDAPRPVVAVCCTRIGQTVTTEVTARYADEQQAEKASAGARAVVKAMHGEVAERLAEREKAEVPADETDVAREDLLDSTEIRRDGARVSVRAEVDFSPVLVRWLVGEALLGPVEEAAVEMALPREVGR